MKKTTQLFLCFLLNLFFITVNAQKIKWSNDNSGYYSIENGEIIKYQLPDFVRTKIIDAAQLTPKGSQKPLDIKGF